MRVPRETHSATPWRIHEIAADFTVEDVWDLPTPGGPDDLPRLVEQITGADGEHRYSPVAAFLFKVRWTLGRALGWDAAGTGVDARVPTLRDRLPDDLRDGPAGPPFRALPFRPLYLTHDEWAAEMANATVQAVMHVGWVADGSGGHHGRMAVLVKPNGFLGACYMAAIKPFRYAGVYPALLRGIGRNWRERAEAAAGDGDATMRAD